ncbi:MAG: carboxypeptidase regulatory-like domain-containing protein [Acidobacteria bacterium]|nr:carboxypeptidase regulatory-like domain-containing protein [Acidobacteriota bacterium]
MNRILLIALASAAFACAQTTNGTIVGSVRDSSDLAVVNAEVRLLQVATGAVRRSGVNERGDFTFTGVAPGEYNVTVSAPGFKVLERRNAVLSASETLALGAFRLEIGALTETVTVTAQGATVQTASSERAGVVTTSQVENLAIRGRNVASLAKLLPGIVLTSESDAVGININVRSLGGRSTMNNLSLDGVSMNDIGNNNGFSVYVSMDAVAEVKILLSNYAAEYGRLAGANIQLVTKSGTRDFHGLGSYFKRHEQFNANTFFNNRLNAHKPRYRFNTWNYSLGGPVYIPGKFNSGRDKLFFFWSQEFWPIQTSSGLRQVTVPTELERAGDFSQSLDLNGRLIATKDPATGQAFPLNRVPASRIESNGQALLKVFPLPNFFETAISARRYNYVFQEDSANPKRTQTLRADCNIRSKNQLFVSWSSRKDDQTAALGLGTSGSTNWPQMVKTFYSKAQLTAVRYTRIVSPTLVNEVNFGYATRPQGDRATGDQVAKNQRDTVGFKAGQFNPSSNPLKIIPNATYGGVTGAANLFVEQRFPHVADHTILNFTDSLAKTWGGHNSKAGIYADRLSTNRKLYALFNGAFAFDRNVNNPLDTGYAYTNGVLGIFSSYTEASNTAFRHYRLGNVEWFLQDNWKINRKLTLDLGARFYWIPPIYDTDNLLSGFAPSRYDPVKAVKLIAPALAGGVRVGRGPVDGKTYNAALIGAIAPGSGDPANGMVTPSTDQSYPRSLRDGNGIRFAPRFGFAYDPFGSGTTAVRGGFGLFFNREILESTTNPFAIQTPVIQNPIVNFGSIPTLLSSTGLLFPENVFGIERNGAGSPTVMNYSFSVQRRVGFGTVVDVAYVGSLGRHLLWRRNLNAVPIGANFLASNADPTNTRVALPPAFLRPVSGYNNIQISEWASSSNYHSLQVTANRRFARSLEFGLAWTWSKAMTYNDADNDEVTSLVSPRVWNYSLSSIDRTHIVNFNWLWTLPKAPWKAAAAKAVLNAWQVSGIASFISGQPVGVGFSTTTALDITGTPNLGARIDATGNPVLPKSERSFSRNFRTEVFRLPARGTIGTAQSPLLRGPGTNNWDVSLFKSFPVGERVRLQFRCEMYNTFNHTQFSSFDTAARFDTATGAQVNARFGEMTAARSPRIIQLALRATF